MAGKPTPDDAERTARRFVDKSLGAGILAELGDDYGAALVLVTALIRARDRRAVRLVREGMTTDEREQFADVFAIVLGTSRGRGKR